MYKDIKRKERWIFNSMHEMSEILRDTIDRESVIGSDHESKKSSGRDWCDTKSLDKAIDDLQYGREYEAFTEMLNSFKGAGHDTKRKITNGVVGHTVIVPLYLQGIPTSMITTRTVINNKIVNIFYNMSVPGYVDSEDIMDTTKDLMARVMELETQGYRVNLYLIRVNGTDHKHAFGLRLKSDRERFNAKKMAFPLVSSSMNRRIGFRVAEALYETSIGYGYGSGTMDYKTTARVITEMFRIKDFELWNYKGMHKGVDK